MTTERMSAERYRSIVAKPKRRKYRNEPTEHNGYTYPSQAQARHAAGLDLQVKAGLIRGWIREVTIPIPHSDRRMRIDALIIENDGRVRWVDVKGMKPTEAWQLKREAVQRGYGITIEVTR